jgi:PucR-like helix-turn-helix protein/diguanylate cyclase with GGDEF domain
VDGQTLEGVLATLDETVLRHAAGPATAAVTDVVILDWTDPEALPAGALVLAVGVEPERPAAATLIDRAGSAAVAGVVVRHDGELPVSIVGAAERAEVALLSAPRGAAWGQLHALLRTALTSGGGAGESGAAGVRIGDLFSLADAIATAVGGPVTIEDPQWRVLAYSNLDQEIDEARRHTILGRTPPVEWRVRLNAAGIARELRRGGIVRFTADELTPRLVAPISAGGELLGSIWLALGEDASAPDLEEQLLRAAEMSATHLIAHRAGEDLKRRARGASVRELLEGVEPAALRGRSAALTPVAFEPHADDRGAWLGGAERVLSVTSLFAEATHREAVCALVDERVWALVPTPAADPAQRLRELAERVVARVTDVLDLRLLAAVGPSAGGVRDVPRARAATERALAVVATRPGAGPVVDVDAMRAEIVLHELVEIAAERPSLREGPLVALAEADRERGDGWRLATLRAYLDAHGDVGAAAERLGVHPNTLRYRVRRLGELTGVDLRDPDERLVTELQLRMLEQTALAS